MTANTINWLRLQEDERTHRAQEEEARRSNLAREAEQSRANSLNYSASIYASDVAKYGHQLDYEAKTYASQMSYAASVNAATLNYNATVESINAQNTRAQLDRDQNLYLTLNAQAETQRHNEASEANQQMSVRAGILNSLIGTLGKISTAIPRLV